MSAIEGMDELLENLGDLTDAALDGATIGLAKGLKRVVATAKLLAPVAEEGGGQLRNSITSTVERKNDTVDGRVIATAEHAIFVEMGTGDRGQASDNGKAPGVATYTAGWPGMEAQPYMYPAYQLTKEQVLDDMRQGAEDRLREVVT